MKKSVNHCRPLKAGIELLDKYRILKYLKQTEFGYEYLVVNIDNSKDKIYRIKEFFPKECAVRGSKNQMLLKPSLTNEELLNFNFLRHQFNSEANNLRKISTVPHPNILNLVEICEDKNTTYMVLIHEEGLLLNEYIDKRKEEGSNHLSNEEMYSFANALLSALAHIHELGICHLNIKPKNILIKKDGTPILLGFYASSIYYDKYTKKYRHMYTDEYASVEQINSAYVTSIDQQSDIYSLGVILYFLISDSLPPRAKERTKVRKSDPYISLFDRNISYNYDASLLSAVDKSLSYSKKYRFKDTNQFKNALVSTNRKHGINLENPFKYLYMLIIPLLLFLTYFVWGHFTKNSKVININDYTKVVNNVENKEIPLQENENNISREEKKNIQKPIFDTKAATIKKDKAVVQNLPKDIKVKEKIENLNIVVNVELPKNIGETIIEINGKVYHSNKMILEKEDLYEIVIKNAYYKTLKIKRRYDELVEFPVQNFTLISGRGKIYISGLPEKTDIKIYSAENNTKILNVKTEYINNQYEMIVMSGQAFYMIFNHNAYKTQKTKIMTLHNKEAVTLFYSLEQKNIDNNITIQKSLPIPVNKKMNALQPNTKISSEVIQKPEQRTIDSATINKKNIKANVEKNDIQKKVLKKKISIRKIKKQVKKPRLKRNKVKKQVKKIKPKIRKKIIKHNIAKKKMPIHTKKSDFVWYCSAKSILSPKVGAKHIDKSTAQTMALRKCGKIESGCRILNCLMLRN